MLTDAHVAALAQQAVALLAREIDLRIEPQSSADPYRFGATAWLVRPLIDGRKASAISVAGDMTGAEALARLLDGLGEDFGETARFRGVAFPPCPGHRHPAQVAAAGDVVELCCPDTGEVVDRIEPLG